MDECREHLVVKEACNHEDCRHAAVLRDVKKAVRTLTHDLSQPIMLLQGHLELLELEKCAFDQDSVHRFMGIIKKQMDVFHDLHDRLRAIAVTVKK